MNPLNFSLLILSTLFFVLFLYRKNDKGFIVKARIIEVEEKELLVPQAYTNLVYYYPLINYQYELNGKVYLGKISRFNARRYRVSKYDSYGFEREDSSFFWRALKVGDEIKIKVDTKKYRNSQLYDRDTPTFKSETYAFLIISLLFGILFVFSFLLL